MDSTTCGFGESCLIATPSRVSTNGNSPKMKRDGARARITAGLVEASLVSVKWLDGKGKSVTNMAKELEICVLARRNGLSINQSQQQEGIHEYV
jgi:hypothetical protein